jgi:macrolide-specific efflux system membrane fusion protein
MTKKYWMIAFVLIVFLFVGIVLFRKNQQSAFIYQDIKRGTIIESVYGIGTLKAEKSFSIKSGVTSTIHKLYVQEGQNVAKGSKLVELEGIGNYKAPFSGTVVFVAFKEGETVYPQSIVMTLVDSTETYLLVSIEQQGALGLKPKLPVKISFDGLRDNVFDGQVESIFSNGGDFLARISLDGLPQFILPGMTADVAIILQEKKDALLIPVAALEFDNAVISRNGKITRIPIKLGLIDGAYAEITSGNIVDGDRAVLIKRVIK